MSVFKNYYQTLGVPPNASVTDIKKRFRKLALKYHPDTNDGNALASMQFREIQEAYEALADTAKRTIYHQEWKMHFPNVNVATAYAQTPESLLADSRKLNQQIAMTDAFRMNKEQFYLQINNLLSTHNIALLKEENNLSANHSIVQELLQAASRLNYEHATKIARPLQELAGDNRSATKEIEVFLRHAKKSKQWEKLYPLLVVLITILISIVIYMASR